MSDDPYAALGVSKTATQDEIRKAYKKIARQSHPDLNPGDPKAADRFKAAAAAHDLLKDEELRAREPLDRRRVEENVTRTDLDSALRVASDIPNEIVYIMCRCVELMKEVVDKGDDLTACSALAAVHLSMAAIRCMQAELLSYAKIMDDDVFGYTIVREAELNLADHQELVDGLVEELTRRLTRAKK